MGDKIIMAPGEHILTPWCPTCPTGETVCKCAKFYGAYQAALAHEPEPRFKFYSDVNARVDANGVPESLVKVNDVAPFILSYMARVLRK